MSNFISLLLACSALTSPLSGTNVNLTKNNIMQSAVASDGFMKIGGYPSPAKVLQCEDGYVYYDLEVLKTRFTTGSNLFIVHTATSFTPGSVARRNGEEGFKDYRLKRGFVHLKLERYNEEGKYGGTIYPKEMWPRSNDFTTTISSSTSYERVFSNTLNQGIEIGDGARISSSTGIGQSLSLSYTKSLSTLTTDPYVSVQFSPNSNYEAQWNFEVIDNTAGDVTFAFDQYFLFEMSEDYYRNLDSAFKVTYSVKYQAQHKLLFGWYDGWEFNESVDVKCFC